MDNNGSVVLTKEDVEHLLKESLGIIDSIYKAERYNNEKLYNFLGITESEFDKIICGEFVIE